MIPSTAPSLADLLRPPELPTQERIPILPKHERAGFKNVIILNISSCLLFIAFSPIVNIHVSEQGNLLGWYMFYILFTTTTFFSPLIVSLAGEKISLLLGATCYWAFFVANLLATKYYKVNTFQNSMLLGATGGVAGFGAAVFWAAHTAVFFGSFPPEKIGAYNGLFFSIIQCSQVLGNLAVGILLYKNTPHFHISLGLVVVSACSIVGFLLLRRPLTNTQSLHHSFKKQIIQTFSVITTKPMALLFPAMIYCGVSQAIFFGMFPQLMHKNVGYIMTTFGTADVFGSVIAGIIYSKVGLMPIIISCALSMTGGSAWFLVSCRSIKSVCSEYELYSIAILWGFSNSAFFAQIYTALGTVFTERIQTAIGVFKLIQTIITALVLTLFWGGFHIKYLDLSKLTITTYCATTLVILWTAVLCFYLLTITPKQSKVK